MGVVAWLGGLTLAAAVGGQVALPDAHTAALRALAPRGVIERRVVALTEAAHARLREELRDDEVPRTWFVYIARIDGAVSAIALFDTHRVRTLRETLLVAFDVDLRVRSIDVVAFAEPRRYLPRASYYGRYEGRARADLEGRGVDAVSGATLTSQATGRAALRALAFGAHLRAESTLAVWADAIPAQVRAAAATAHAVALARLRARFPDAEVRPRTRLASAPDDGAWIEAFQVLGDPSVARSVFVHVAVAKDTVVSTLVTLLPDGRAESEPLGSEPLGSEPISKRPDTAGAVAAVRAMLARDGGEPPR